MNRQIFLAVEAFILLSWTGCAAPEQTRTSLAVETPSPAKPAPPTPQKPKPLPESPLGVDKMIVASGAVINGRVVEVKVQRHATEAWRPRTFFYTLCHVAVLSGGLPELSDDGCLEIGSTSGLLVNDTEVLLFLTPETPYQIPTVDGEAGIFSKYKGELRDSCALDGGSRPLDRRRGFIKPRSLMQTHGQSRVDESCVAFSELIAMVMRRIEAVGERADKTIPPDWAFEPRR